MNLIKRMMRISSARIEAFLSSVEDPETMFPQLVREMEEQVGKATEAEAQALTALKLAEKTRDTAKANVERMQAGAELALKNSDESTAREAIAAQLDLEKALKQKAEACDRAQGVYENARSVRAEIKEKLDETRAKQDEILTRARLAKTQKKITETVSSPIHSTDSILDAIERLENKVELAEAELEVERELAGNGATEAALKQRLEQLETEQEVDKRFAELKNKLSD
ncbi:Phage shock protein A [Pontiella desulfatans]|uniref:Phage shock protein A n=1 Tax=Pontiella desulfatans TaxID=2750659 RepID=A0A6C2TVF2_PONDE|nr:PspA/IM30 family protein [Pontiella desulfatans]VGO11625.1 Phage shock protein A [Pontiella desulfatans]